MPQLLAIFAWIGTGLALKRLIPRSAVLKGLNHFIIWFSLPATVLLALHALRWEMTYAFPISMAWIVFLVSLPLFALLAKKLRWSRQTLGALVLTTGLGNTSFVGYPLLRALYGERALSIAVLNDQPGSFLVLSTLGIYSACYFASKQSSFAALVRRILRFPPVWATVLAFALRSIEFPQVLQNLLGLGARTLIPLALISVGSQLDFSRSLFERELSPMIWGLAYKLLLAPLMILLLFVAVLHQHGEAMRITVLEAAMGPMITGAILAREYELDPPLCSLLVSVGIPLCLISVPIWAKCLEWLGV